MRQEPVLTALLPALLIELGSAAALLTGDHTEAGVIAAVAAFLTGAGGVLARSLVTPVPSGDPS